MRDCASTWSNLLKQCISANCFLIVALVQSALRKELSIAPFVQRINTAFWAVLNERFGQYLRQLLKHCISVHFLLIDD